MVVATLLGGGSVRVLACVGAAFAAAMSALCVDVAHAGDEGPGNPIFLLFAGTDLWRDGAFLNGGLLWSPGGLDKEGFTLKVLLAGGHYTYPSSGLGQDVAGTLVSASVLPGWRMSRDGLIVSFYAGPIVQDYRLSPDDPSSRLRGGYAGGQISTDVWYQPNLDADRARWLCRLYRTYRLSARRLRLALDRNIFCRA